MSVSLDTIILFLFIFTWVLSYVTSNKSTNDVIKSGQATKVHSTKEVKKVDATQNIDYINKGMYYQEVFNLEGVSMLFLILKLLWAF
jgi:hypothetical protein